MRCAQCDADISLAPVCPECSEDPRLGDRYLLESVIGQGASGTVYRARDPQTQATLAIKALPFHREFDATHPGPV